MNVSKRIAAAATSVAVMVSPAAALAAGQSGQHGQSGQPHGKSGLQHGKAGQHGNHCGRGHAKHVKGQKGLAIGKTCQKTKHGHSQSSTESSTQS